VLDQSAVDDLRERPVSPGRHFIGGQWRDSSNLAGLDVLTPIDGTILTTIADAAPDDVDRAVRAARKAFDDGHWSRAAPGERKKVLHRLADLIQANALELAVLGVRDNGTEIGMAFRAEPGSAAGTFRYYAEAIDKVYGEIAPTAEGVLGLVHREPIGVIGAIVPWNFPLMIGAWKIAPALAAGNSIVLKPPETASLALLRLAELAAEAGLPDGVLNVVTGQGAIAGKELALHNDVDVLAFTGSGATGCRLMEYAAASNLKRVYLELGGKSPNIVFADAADLDEAAVVSAKGIFRNAGQVCVAGSRLLVEESIHDAFVDRLIAATEKMTVGDPLDLGTDIGAVNSQGQLDKDLAFVVEATEEGADLAFGGDRLLEETGGYYMAPTILTGVRPTMNIAQQEVFGPVLAVTPFSDAEEAIRLANSTTYGLAAGVWTSNLGTAHRMVRAVRAGVVHVNTWGGTDATVPMGGMRQSGNGQDKSLHALDKFTDLKTAWIQL